MEGVQDIKNMLRSMMEQQEKLMAKVEGIQEKVVGIEEKVAGIEEKQDELALVVPKIDTMARQLRRMDWRRLRWRQMEWERIPPDSRERVIPFLTVQDVLSLDTAMCVEGEEKLRDKLKESYEEAVIPAFDTYRFTDKDNFEGLRWVMKAEIELQGCVLVLREQEGGVMKSQAKVLRWLVDNGHADLAAVHGMKSSAKDMMKHDAECGEEISTVWLVAWKGYAPVVRGLVSRGAEINKPRARTGTTPLYVASYDGYVDVVRVLVEHGADITKTWDNKTPLQIARQKSHPEIIHLLELAAQA